MNGRWGKGHNKPDCPYSYRALCAATYDLLIPSDILGDQEFFRAAIARGGEPALEIGCGTGRLLLQYLRAGLEVEGVDASPEMLAICRRKARELGLVVTLHEQQMQSLQLTRRYRTVFVPAGSFMLLTEREDAERALAAFHAHLEPGGQALIPLNVLVREDVAVGVAPAGEWRLRREGKRPDGATVQVWERATYDIDQQIKHSQCRYQVSRGSRLVVTEDHVMTLRWYTQEQIAGMLQRAGFSAIRALQGYSEKPAGPEVTAFTMIGGR